MYPSTAASPFGGFRLGGDRKPPSYLEMLMKFEDYYKEFCEVFGHPLWIMPMMLIGFFFMVEVMHTKYHADGERDAHGFCGRQEWVKDLVRYKENNMY